MPIFVIVLIGTGESSGFNATPSIKVLKPLQVLIRLCVDKLSVLRSVESKNIVNTILKSDRLITYDGHNLNVKSETIMAQHFVALLCK